MEPALSGGDTIYLDRNYPYEDLKVGDVIAYYDVEWGISYGLLHRILVESKETEFIVKGDNNRSADPFNLTKDNYNGKVIRVDFK